MSALDRDVAECSVRCRSRLDASQTTSLIRSSASDAATLHSLIMHPSCNVPGKNGDLNGTTALHMAASKGKVGVMLWLLTFHSETSINAKDVENGYTALHRALFYGQLRAGQLLIDRGANLNVCDFEGLNALDHLVLDAPHRSLSLGPCEAYVWGVNASLNLGLGHQQARLVPELHDGLRKVGFVKKAALQKFHSVFLTHSGKVFSCGHGQGGRLGHSDEHSQLTLKQVRVLDEHFITEVALGLDHSVFMSDQGQVFVCGINNHHQLGVVPPPKELLAPQIVNCFSVGNKQTSGSYRSPSGSNKQTTPMTTTKQALGIGAGRYHSLLWTKDELFTWGLNAGQLGHVKNPEEQTVVIPKLVSSLFQRKIGIRNVVTSEGAVIVLSEQGDVFALHEYQTKRIAVKQLGVVKIEVIGGHLDYRVSSKVLGENLKLVERGGQDLKVFVLNNIGRVSVWEEKNSGSKNSSFMNCVLSLSREVVVTDIALNRSNLMLVTEEGQAYEATHVQRRATTSSATTGSSSSSSSSIASYLEKNVSDLLKVRRLPHIFRGTAAFSDPKGRNYCILQQVANANLIDLPQVDVSTMRDDFKELLSSASEEDELHDVVFEAGSSRFAAHKFVVASASDVLARMIAKREDDNANNNDEDNRKVVKVDVEASLFQQILTFIYTHTCDLIQPGFVVCPPASPTSPTTITVDLDNRSKKKSKNKKKNSTNNDPKDSNNNNSNSNILTELQMAARSLGVSALVKVLDNFCLESNVVTSIRKDRQSRRGVMAFNSKGFPELSDCVITCGNGVTKRCHKCILAARLEYFRSMFTLSWMESHAKETQLSLPIESKVLHVLLEYIYRDEVAPKLFSEESDEFVFNVLVVADQLLARRLVQLCEQELAQRLSLRNVVDILQCTADHFEAAAPQLFRSAKHFLCQNLAAAMDAKMLSGLSDEVLEDLGRHYRNEATQIGQKRRLIADNDSQLSLRVEQRHESNPLSVEELLQCEQDTLNNNSLSGSSPSKPRTRVQRRGPRRNSSGGSSDSDSNNNEPVGLNRTLGKPKSSTSVLANVANGNKGDSSDNFDDLDEKNVVKATHSNMESKPEVTSNLSITKHKEETESSSTSFLESFFLNRKVDPLTAASVRNASAAGEWNKRFTRKSQRERQREAETAHNERKSEKNASNEQTSSWSGWGEVESGPSFTEIIKRQKEEADGNMDAARNAAKGNRVKRASWKALSLSEETATTTNPSSEEHKNPWTKNVTLTPTATATSSSKHADNGCRKDDFASILDDELRQSENLHRVQSKPLLLTQIEEQAILELERFYNVDNAVDEMIRVERVPQGQMATPIWLKQ